MSETVAATKDDVAHLQQLIRELVAEGSTQSSFSSRKSSSVKEADGADGVDNFDQISYSITQIFQSGKEIPFTEQLNFFINRKEAEIEKMCNFHYQEFVQSVDQLLKVRVGTASIRTKLNNLNKEIQQSGSKILDKRREIVEFRRTQVNIESTIESLQSCLFILNIMGKIQTQINSKKYYSALRMLEDLQSNKIKLIKDFKFMEHISGCIPKMKQSIIDAVVKEMNEWFVKIREKTRLVGKLAIERTTAQQARLQRQRALMGTSSSKLDLLMTEDSTNTYEFDIDDVQLDFKPLYQCLHIHEVLERREEFKKSYEENRHHQAQLVLDTKLVFDEKLENFSTYLNDIVGFFIIEAMILNTTQNFRSRGNIEGLWKMAVEKINLVITESLHDCQNPKLFLNIKVMVGVFIRTIEGYGYAVNKLTDLIVSLFDRYAELMKLSCCETIIKIIEDDEYAPLVVQTPEELKDVNAAFKYTETSKIATTRFPRSLPFSKGFILCCSNIKEFIDVFYRFAESFSKQHTAMDDVIKKALDELLQRQLNSAILDQIMISNLSQVVQIIVNIGFICQACKEFEEMIEKNSNSKPGTVTLQATKTFQETINVAEKRIFELLNTKIDDFLELADYEWEAVESNDSPSPYLLELVNYLTSVITSTLSNLTPSLKSYLYFDSFGHLGRALNGLWLNPSVKIISLGFVRTFKIDVLFLKTFVKGLGDIEIGDAFVELDQTIEYLLSERYEDFLDAAVRSAKYNRIKVSNAVVLLEKLKGPDVGVFSKVSAHEAARKRHIAGVIKSINASQKSASPGKSMFG